MTRNHSNGGNLGFKAALFKAADKLRGNMEPNAYKHVALGLIFLKLKRHGWMRSLRRIWPCYVLMRRRRYETGFTLACTCH